MQPEVEIVDPGGKGWEERWGKRHRQAERRQVAKVTAWLVMAVILGRRVLHVLAKLLGIT